MTIDERAYDGIEHLLVCPKDRGPLSWRWSDGVVFNPRLLLGYPIRDGIAQLLDTEAFAVDTSGKVRIGGSAE